MTFEETMHTIESHLEALQEQHNNEIIKLRHQLLEMQELARDYRKRCQELQNGYDRLLVENNQLKEQNAYLMRFKKANTTMHKGEYNNA